MRLLDRYLFRELLTPLAYCLGGFLIFWTSFNLFYELPDLQERKLHLLDVVEYCVAMTPDFLVLVLPVALLLALLYTLTNHARHNEITAMRAAGISLGRISAPYFVVGFFASLAVFGLNEFCVPHGTDWANQIKGRYVQKAQDLRTQTVFPKFSFTNERDRRIWVVGEYHSRTAEMLNPQVNWTLPDGSSRQLNAARAIRTNGMWTFFNVQEFTQSGTQLIPSLQTNLLALPEFSETPKQIESEIKMSYYSGFQRERRADISLGDILGYLRLHPSLPREDKAKLLTKFHGRLAAPWTCIVVVLMAIPFGAASGRRNLFGGVAGSIFIVFGYFVIQKISLAMGAGGHLPAWLAAWLPNMVFGALGLFLAARAR